MIDSTVIFTSAEKLADIEAEAYTHGFATGAADARDHSRANVTFALQTERLAALTTFVASQTICPCYRRDDEVVLNEDVQTADTLARESALKAIRMIAMSGYQGA